MQYTRLLLTLLIPFSLCFPAGKIKDINGNISGQVQYGDSTNYFSRYISSEHKLSVLYKSFLMGSIGIETHSPPPPHYLDSSQGYGITHYGISVCNEILTGILGTFYTESGKGLVVSLKRYTELGIDNNILGGYFSLHIPKLEFSVFGGIPRETFSDRADITAGSEFIVSPGESFTAGLRYAVFHDVNPVLPGYIHNWSVNTDIHIKNKYAGLEAAFQHYKSYLRGHAVYAEAQTPISSALLQLQLGKYYNYSLHNGTIFYNSFPSLLPEPEGTLLKRLYTTVNGDDALGGAVQLSIPVKNHMIEGAYGRIHSHNGELTEQMWMLLVKLKKMSIVNLTLSALVNHSYSAIAHAERIAADFDTKVPFSVYQSIKFYRSIYAGYYDTEHLLTVSSEIYKNINIFINFEYAWYPSSQNTGWFGGGASFKNKYVTISFFAGSRNGGKNCYNGVCVYEPPFTGFEASIIYNIDFL
jgi:hypothetical protein